MTLEPPDPPPVDITKATRRPVHRFKMAGTEPRWAPRPFGAGWRYVCATCARPPGQHYNPGGQRWWHCQEIDDIQEEIDYYSQPAWRRLWNLAQAALYRLTHRRAD